MTEKRKRRPSCFAVYYEEAHNDNDIIKAGDSDHFVGVKRKANQSVNQRDSTFRISYESLGDQAKLSKSDRFFVRTGKGCASFKEFDNYEHLLDHLEIKYHSVSHISKFDSDKIYVTSCIPSSTTQIFRNLLEDGPDLLKHRHLNMGTSPKAIDLSFYAGNLKLATLQRHLLLFKKRSENGSETGEKVFCVFNNDEAPAGFKVETSEQTSFIIFYTTSQLLARDKKNHPFHELYMCLLRNQVCLFTFC